MESDILRIYTFIVLVESDILRVYTFIILMESKILRISTIIILTKSKILWISTFITLIESDSLRIYTFITLMESDILRIPTFIILTERDILRISTLMILMESDILRMKGGKLELLCSSQLSWTQASHIILRKTQLLTTTTNLISLFTRAWVDQVCWLEYLARQAVFFSLLESYSQWLQILKLWFIHTHCWLTDLKRAFDERWKVGEKENVQKVLKV